MVPVCAPSRLSLQPDPALSAQLCQGMEAEAQHRPSLGQIVLVDFNRCYRRPSPSPTRPIPPSSQPVAGLPGTQAMAGPTSDLLLDPLKGAEHV